MTDGSYIVKGVRLLALVAVVVMAACKPTVPSRYIQPDELEDILYDYHLSKAIAMHGHETKKADFDRNKYLYAVLQKHGVSRADFDSSMVYYYTNADRLLKVYKAVGERMDNEAAYYGASVSDNNMRVLSATGDTANVWRGSRSTLLMPTPLYNRMDFSLKVDTSYRKGDEFNILFTSDFLYQSGTKDAVAYVAITFDNDSVAQYYTRITSSGKSQLRIPSNHDNAIRKIEGFIYLSRGNDTSNTLKLLFIDQIQFIRFHKKKVEKPKASISEKADTAKTDTVIPTKNDTLKPLPPPVRRNSATVKPQKLK